jgi:hypothetical protein
VASLIYRFRVQVRDALLAEGLAEEHRWVPNSGWTSFHVRSEDDFKHAVWLMRLSYLRYALKTVGLSNFREPEVLPAQPVLFE